MAVDGLEVSYGGSARSLRGVSLTIHPATTVAVLGANGAGKTTLLRAVTGLLGHHHGRVSAGTIQLDGRDVTGVPAAIVVRGGVGQVMEGRRIFGPLTVEENLRAGGYVLGRRRARAAIDRQLDAFPVLARKRHERASSLSGGEQQQLAIARALMPSPRLLVLDEPTLGLAPLVVAQVRDLLQALRAGGTTILVAEQRAAVALAVADEVHVLAAGVVVRRGKPDELDAGDLAASYLGAA